MLRLLLAALVAVALPVAGMPSPTRASDTLDKIVEVVDLFGERPYNVLPIAWAMRKGDPEFVQFMNTSLDYMMINGRLDQLAAKYGPSGRFQLKPVYEPVGVAGSTARAGPANPTGH